MPNSQLIVQIDIPDPMIYCFIHSLFKKTAIGLKVTTWSATGAVICALTQTSNLRCIHPKNSTTVELVLPSSNMNRLLFGRFIHISPGDAEKIIAVLKREFSLAFATYLYEGQIAGLNKKQIVDLFINDHNLGDVPTAFETLTKRRQRLTQYAIRDFNRKLQQKASDEVKKARKKLHAQR